ncbi:MAG: phosphoribosylglycinamide formyltransferase [Leptospiraceae bacterium]|nr:phosphoribosylglycinamide formyltransferase [Leptospiraceae bacterium]MDW8307126.1 phosphoribosylglycinamide formyltransferase [Leptospiraceae bacterium]
MKKRIAIFISGRGSNMRSLLERIKKGDLKAQCEFVFSDRHDAPGLQKAQHYGVTTYSFGVKEFSSKERYEAELLRLLQKHQVEFIVCAGYMKLIGKTLLDAYPYRIVNIHPSLLPAFPGLRAQKQALDYGVRYSGCTVHFIDEGVDTGPIIAQAVCEVSPKDTEESLSRKILKLEHELYWRALQKIFAGYEIKGRRVIFKR